jgi:DNA-binding NtrC family response regulator
MAKVLVIDDNPTVVSALQLLLGLHDITCLYALSPQEGLQVLQNHDDILLVIQDMNFSDGENSGAQGKALFYAIRDLYQDLPIILFTAWTQLEMAVALIKEGAADYLSKPWDDQKLIVTINNLLELGRLQRENMQRALTQCNARSALEQHYNLCGIVYQSEEMQKLLEVATKIARADVPVMITGPNGSGKEKIAEIIQANSSVAKGPFIKVNVGALPDELMEAELFGAEPGAYTGLTKARKGRFELADGGTLFLDELGNLSANGQAKLLRVLQSGEFERLGSSVTQQCKVRVISATNANLVEAIQAGRFREDLYYRLNVIELKLPALADRRDDILPLLNRFIDNNKKLSVNTIRQLQDYDWPGNVRELENACKRASLLATHDTLQASDFGISFHTLKSQKSVKPPEPTKQLIEFVMRENCGVIAQAARQLGISRQALYRRLDKYNMTYETD